MAGQERLLSSWEEVEGPRSVTGDREGKRSLGKRTGKNYRDAEASVVFVLLGIGTSTFLPSGRPPRFLLPRAFSRPVYSTCCLKLVLLPVATLLSLLEGGDRCQEEINLPSPETLFCSPRDPRPSVHFLAQG